MTRKRVLVFVAVVAGVVLVVGGAALAQNPPPGQRFGRWAAPMAGPQRPFRGLDLTQEQRDQLKVLAEERRQQDEPAATRLQELNDALHTELFADVPDQGTIEQLKIDLNQAHRQALDARVAAQLKLAQVLTPEQRQQVREARNGSRARGRFGPRGVGGW